MLGLLVVVSEIFSHSIVGKVTKTIARGADAVDRHFTEYKLREENRVILKTLNKSLQVEKDVEEEKGSEQRKR